MNPARSRDEQAPRPSNGVHPPPSVDAGDKRGHLSAGLWALFYAGLFGIQFLGPAIPRLNQLPGGDLNSYIMACLMLVSGLCCFSAAGNGVLRGNRGVLFSFCLLFITIYTWKFASFGFGPQNDGFRVYRDRTLGFWYALCAALIYAGLGNPGSRRFFLVRTTQIIAGAFCIQVLLSLLQSRFGMVFEREGFVTEWQHNIEGRDLMETSTKQSFMAKLGLNYAMSGLLGQQNRFGVQLVFYNILFLTQARGRLRWLFYALCGLVCVAALLNTTKTGILSILLTDTLFAALVFGRYLRFRWLVLTLAPLVAAVVVAVLWERLVYYADGIRTMSLRFILWDRLWDYFGAQASTHPGILLWGFGIEESFQILRQVLAEDATGLMASFENEAFMMIYCFGMVPTVAFVVTAGAKYLQSWRWTADINRPVYLLLPLCMLICAISMDLETKPFVLPLIALTVFWLQTEVPPSSPPPVRNWRRVKVTEQFAKAAGS